MQLQHCRAVYLGKHFSLFTRTVDPREEILCRARLPIAALLWTDEAFSSSAKGGSTAGKQQKAEKIRTLQKKRVVGSHICLSESQTVETVDSASGSERRSQSDVP